MWKRKKEDLVKEDKVQKEEDQSGVEGRDSIGKESWTSGNTDDLSGKKLYLDNIW